MGLGAAHILGLDNLMDTLYLTWKLRSARSGELQLVEVFGDPELRRRRPLSRSGLDRRLDLRQLLQREYVQHCESILALA